MRHFAPLFLTWRTVDEICCSKGRIQFLPEPIESCVWFCIYLVTVSDLSSIDHFSSEQKKITYSDKFMESSQAFCWMLHLLFGNGSIFFSFHRNDIKRGRFQASPTVTHYHRFPQRRGPGLCQEGLKKERWKWILWEKLWGRHLQDIGCYPRW